MNSFIFVICLYQALGSFFGIDLYFKQTRCFSQFQESFQELAIEATSNSTGLEIQIHKRFNKPGSLYHKINAMRVKWILNPNTTDYYQICVRNIEADPILVWLNIDKELKNQNPFDTLDNSQLNSISFQLDQIESQISSLEVTKHHITEKIKEQDFESLSLESTLMGVSLINVLIYGVLQLINYFITKKKLKLKKDS